MTQSINQDAQKIMKALQAPFSVQDIEWRVSRAMKTAKGEKAVVIPYVTNRAIQKRLDELFSPFGWQNVFKEWREKGVSCGISILWNGEWIQKWDGADESNYEATKGGFSGSQKRAAVQWGIGRYLYDLDEYWVDVKGQGQNYINDNKSGIKGYWDTPKLPDWALPLNERRTSSISHPQSSSQQPLNPTNQSNNQQTSEKPVRSVQPSERPRWITGAITQVEGMDINGSPCYVAHLNNGAKALMPANHPFCTSDQFDYAVENQVQLKLLTRTWEGYEAVTGETGKEIQLVREVA
jgi:hypothetical protein